jgi:hypothetical protein
MFTPELFSADPSLVRFKTPTAERRKTEIMWFLALLQTCVIVTMRPGRVQLEPLNTVRDFNRELNMKEHVSRTVCGISIQFAVNEARTSRRSWC